MKDLNSIMRQAQAMQAKLQEAQGRLAQADFEGQAGAGLVRITVTGGGEMKGIVIDPSLLAEGDAEMLGDLIVAAHADAKRRADEAQAALMRETMGPLAGALPGGLKF
jgi:DNA-binding YbaB/EbfC family protein